jgi:glycosyltransferase involved in cell wall biosynthesis
MTDVVVVHDYLTQRGGAERVALELVRAFPGSRLVTSVYTPETTFPEFADVEISELGLRRVPGVRGDVRRALPLLAPAFSMRRVDAEVVLCSSSGWAHGISTSGSKVVYCHTPARWLYLRDDYLGDESTVLRRVALASLSRPLRAWDRRSARSADRYLANSSVVADRIRAIYGIDARVITPPPAVTSVGPQQALGVMPDRFVLCVARLLPYKHVGEVIEGARLADVPIVVVGDGPLAATVDDRLAAAPAGSCRVHGVSDDELRWLYSRAAVLVAAAHEDLGLTPLEAASCGTPTVALRAGGYLDTVVEGLNGTWIEYLDPRSISSAIEVALGHDWDAQAIRDHGERFSAARFHQELRSVVNAISER